MSLTIKLIVLRTDKGRSIGGECQSIKEAVYYQARYLAQVLHDVLHKTVFLLSSHFPSCSRFFMTFIIIVWDLKTFALS